MTPWLLGEWPGWLILYGTLCVLGAAIVRGYSGFGFSLIGLAVLVGAQAIATMARG